MSPLSLNIDRGNLRHGIELIKQSKLLKFILFTVVAMQVSATLMEYQFGVFVKETFHSLDLRTAYMGKVLSVVNSINVFIQFFGGFVLIKTIGVMAIHVMIPVTLFAGLSMSFVVPNVQLMTLNYGLIKCYDYSLFGIVKGMLYIPLSIEEKFQAKSIIDILAYRGSKAIASVVIFILYSHSLDLRIVLITLFLVWSMVALRTKKIQQTQLLPYYLK